MKSAELLSKIQIPHRAVFETHSTPHSAKQIHDAVLAALGAAESAVQKAILCGHLLLEQKATMPNGQWLPWLTRHCPEISHDTAQRWMRVAQTSLSSVDLAGVDLPASQLLTMPVAELPPEAQEARQLLLDFMEGKTIKQCLAGIVVEGDEPHRLTRALNGQSKGGHNGEDRKAWDTFIRVKLKDIGAHLGHWKAFKGGQAEAVEKHFGAAVEQWPTPVLEFLSKQIREELKAR